jgi:hypothetical protein
MILMLLYSSIQSALMVLRASMGFLPVCLIVSVEEIANDLPSHPFWASVKDFRARH